MARLSIRVGLLPLIGAASLVLLSGLLLWLGKIPAAFARPPAATFIVSNTADSGPGSLRSAIQDANLSPGADLISVTAAGTLNLLTPLPAITDTVSIVGSGAGVFFIDGQDQFRIIDILGVDVSMFGLAVQRGLVTGPSANGAGIRSTGDLVLEVVQVLSNTAQGGGGGVYVTGDLIIANGLFRNNRSINGNGGALRSCCLAVITGTHFVSNTAGGDGGGAYILGDVTIMNGLFLANQCQQSSCDGGGLYSFSQTTLANTHFISNTAQDDGGGAASPGDLTITNGLFEGNHAVTSVGGGLSAQDRVTLQATRFLSNTAWSQGGGVHAFGAVTVTGGLFEANMVLNDAGGGLYAFGGMSVDRTSFLRNIATRGGGIYHDFEQGRVINSLFAENQSTSGSGAALFLASAGAVDLRHATIAGPDGTGSSAIEVLTGTVRVTNTIISSSTVGISNSGGLVREDFNLFYHNGINRLGPVFGGGNSLTGNPLFLNPTSDDYHISPFSAAIDTGADAGVAVDFDGDSRPLDSGFEIGFDEVDRSIGSPTPTHTPPPTLTVTPGPSPSPPSMEDEYLYLPLVRK